MRHMSLEDVNEEVFETDSGYWNNPRNPTSNAYWEEADGADVNANYSQVRFNPSNFTSRKDSVKDPNHIRFTANKQSSYAPYHDDEKRDDHRSNRNSNRNYMSSRRNKSRASRSPGNKDGPNKDQKYVRPAHSRLRQNLELFYWNYFTASDPERFLSREIPTLTEWIRYTGQSLPGQADQYYNLRPAAVSEVFEEVHRRKPSDTAAFADRWQLFFEGVEEQKGHSVLRSALLLSIHRFKLELSKNEQVASLRQLESKMKQIGQRGWYAIPARQLSRYLDCFDVLPIQKPEDVKIIRVECDRLWKARRNVDLSLMIHCFGLHAYYDCKTIVEDLIREHRIREVVRFVRYKRELATLAVELMHPVDHVEEARELIRIFQLDATSYPIIHETQVFAAIKSHITRLGWEFAEEKLINESKDLLEAFIKCLWDQKLYNEAMSVQQRHKVDLKLEREQQDQDPTYSLISNRLLSEDQFGPTEVYLNGKPAEEYLTLADLGVKESDVHYLDSVDETFHSVTSKLLQSHTVGVDCEFISDVAGFFPQTLSTLQIANSDIVAIIDCVKLQQNAEHYVFCKHLFEDPNIQKIGHTFSSDVGVLRASFKNKPMDFVNVINIDEAFVVKNQKLGLAKIVKEVYKKELCKINQQSNWKKRPLRKSQLHYGALDAVSVLHLYQKTLNEKDPRVEGIEPETYSQSAASSESNSKLPLMVNEKAIKAKIAAKKGFKFLLDGMLKKLALNMRNLNLDTAVVPDGATMSEILKQAAQEDRIVLTRAKKLVLGSKDTPLIRIASTNPFAQMQQLMTALHLSFTKDDLLKRCTKCNISPLTVISKEEALQVMKWDDPDTIEAKEFWQCAGCKQIYWEGGNFENGQSMKMLELLMRDRGLLAAVEEDQQEPTEGAEVEDNSQGGNVEEMMA